jgi:hypothetical protein
LAVNLAVNMTKPVDHSAGFGFVVVPETGLEPVRMFSPTVFKTVASAISPLRPSVSCYDSTPRLCRQLVLYQAGCWVLGIGLAYAEHLLPNTQHLR